MVMQDRPTGSRMPNQCGCSSLSADDPRAFYCVRAAVLGRSCQWQDPEPAPVPELPPPVCQRPAVSPWVALSHTLQNAERTMRPYLEAWAEAEKRWTAAVSPVIRQLEAAAPASPVLTAFAALSQRYAALAQRPRLGIHSTISSTPHRLSPTPAAIAGLTPGPSEPWGRQ